MATNSKENRQKWLTCRELATKAGATGIAVGLASILAFTPTWGAALTKVPAPPPSTSQQIWNNAVAAAQKEGKVVFINRFPSGLRTTLGEAFKQKYGIDIEFISGSVPELQPKIIAERGTGLYLQDLVQAGVPSQLDLKKANLLAPMERELILPEVKDPMVWRDKRLPLQDKEGYVLMFLSRVGPTILANRDLVKSDEIKSWRNLLEPKWRGKMVCFDPTVAGPGNAIITTVDELMGRDYLRELAKQELALNRDMRTQVEWVARGKYPLALGFEFTMMEEMRAAGAPLFHIVPSQGTYSGAATGAMGLFDHPAHPNAARVFINWFLSRETQALFSREAKEQSRRVDVISELASDRLHQNGIKYLDGDTKYMLDKRDEMLKLSKEIFAAQNK